jgi:hypothetical protein
VLGLLLAAVVGVSAGPRPYTPVRTLVTANGPITAFAQNGRFVSWASVERGTSRCSTLVRIRDLVRGYQNAVTDAAGPTCQSDLLVSRLALGLAGKKNDARAVWLRYETGTDQHWHLSTGSLSAPRERSVADLVYPNGDEVRLSLFGDGTVLGYAWSAAGTVDEGGCLENGTDCPFRVNEGGEVRVGVTADSPQPQVPPAAAADVSGQPGYGRLAVLVRGHLGDDTEPNAPLRDIEIRNPSNYGALIGHFTVARPVRALAVSSNTVAVLTDRAIDLYTISGVLRTEQPVPPTTAPELSISSAGVVYHVGRSIRVLGRGEVAIAASAPIGLSIDNHRIAWAENIHVAGMLVGRIRALDLGS